MKSILPFVFTTIFFMSCTKKDLTHDGLVHIIDDKFNLGTDFWVADFADYPVGQEDFYSLKSSHAKLPAPLDQNDGAIFISGNNHSDDLFMFLKKKTTGLKPNTTYKATFDIELTSNAPSNAVGIVGPPGESVFLGIGITSTEPQKVNANGTYRMNINKGNQSREDTDRKIIGNIANGTDQSEYVLLKKNGEIAFTTDSSGTVWVSISTDSGFEGVTSLYYSAIKIHFYEI